MSTLLKAKIYKIVCNKTNQIYIGSTTKDLDTRLHSHELDFKKYCRNRYHFVTSFAILCNNDYSIELITDVQCSSNQELHKIEGAYIQDHQDICVNKNIPGRSKKQYYQDNKQITCECGSAYKAKDKAKHFRSSKHLEYEANVWQDECDY